MDRSTLSAGIPSIEIHLGQTAVGPVATVLQTVRGRITTGRTARKERTDQATVVINIASVLAAPIPGMIQIGPSSTIVAVIFQISLWAHCRSPCQRWVERAANGAGATPAHVAVPLLGIASSLIGTARRVMASRSWTQPMTNWAAIVGFSGTSKTPGIDATKRALSQIERDRRSKIDDLRCAHEGRVEAAKAARALWKKEVERAAEGKVVSLDEYRNTVTSEPVMPAAAS